MEMNVPGAGRWIPESCLRRGKSVWQMGAPLPVRGELEFESSVKFGSLVWPGSIDRACSLIFQQSSKKFDSPANERALVFALLLISHSKMTLVNQCNR